MADRRRFRVISLTILAVLALAALAAGLNQAVFSPGSDYWFGSGEMGDGVATLLEGEAGESPLLPYVGWFGTIMVLLLPVGLTLYIIKPELRKRLLSFFIQGMVLVLFATLLSSISEGIRDSSILQPPQEETAVEGGEVAAGEALPEEGVPAPARAPVPDWLVAAASALAAGLLLVVGRKLQKRIFKPNPLKQLGLDAEEALQSIRRGGDLRDTIRRCYFEMSQTLREEHSLQRNQAMTAREFERLLEESGLPRLHVQQLTRLFEGVRYGGKTPSDADERLAVDCLSSIVQAAEAGGAA